MFLLTGMNLNEDPERNIGRWRVKATIGTVTIDDRYFLIKDGKAQLIRKRSDVLKQQTG
jgi:hypothetical protein